MSVARLTLAEAVVAGFAPATDLRLEADFRRAVRLLARRGGWLYTHYRPGLTQAGRWATAVEGDVGGPDILLARGGVAISVELKTDAGRLGPGQGDWAKELGASYRLWRPNMWPEIVAELR